MSGTVLLLGLLVTAPVAASEPESDGQLLERAESAFRAGREAQADPRQAREHFARAAAFYEELRRRGYRNVALFLNQGNANLLAGDLPRAILAYRRGLRLNLADPSLLYNVATARDEVVGPGSRARQSLDIHWFLGVPVVQSEVPWKFAILSYMFFWLLILLWSYSRRRRILGLAVGFLAVTSLVGAYVFAGARHFREEVRYPLVVVARDGVVLRTGNGDAYPRRLDVPLGRGVEARQLFTRGGWLQIELAGGAVGWMRRAEVLTDDD